MIRKNKSLEEIAEIILESDNIALVPHCNADGDAFASTLALNIALRKLQKKSYVCSEEDLPSSGFTFLNKYIKFGIYNGGIGKSDCVILTDVSNIDRVQFREEVESLKREGIKVIVIDHHRGGNEDRFADYYYVDEEAAACAEIIYDLINYLGVKIDKNIATCLLVGVISDTSSFVNQNTTESTFKIASALVSRGARLNDVIENSFRGSSLKQLKLRGIAMERLVYNEKYRSAVSFLTNKDFEKLDMEAGTNSGIANILNTMKGVDIVFFVVEEEPGRIKVSMRTRNENVDLSKLAGRLGGGGHKGASGFSFDGTIENLGDGVLIKDVDKVFIN